MSAIMVLLVAILGLVPAAPAATFAPAPAIAWEVVSRRAHDSAAFTQGLALDTTGRLFESTGLYGESTLRELDPLDGRVIRRLDLPAEWFAEGLALVDDDLVQLTWKAGVAVRRAADTFEVVDTYVYDGEGWGLCFDGQRLVMSDGSAELTFRDRHTFEVIGSVTVTLDGRPLTRLNELECVDGAVWANVWYRDEIVRIDPSDGRVTGVLDLTGLVDPHPRETAAGAVLNGIAWDASAGSFLVTGKRWPQLIEIRLVESDVDGPASG